MVTVLRETADRLESGSPYQWTHFGRCNCGQLAQTITRLPAAELHRRAQERPGEWSEQAEQYCPASGETFDRVLDALFEFGLEPRDVGHLEYLSDPEVLRTFPEGQRHLRRNQAADVVRYLRAWAGLLERRLPARPAAEPVAALRRLECAL